MRMEIIFLKEKNNWKLQWSIKTEAEFPVMFKKKSCGISMGLRVFDLGISTKESHIILQNFEH